MKLHQYVDTASKVLLRFLLFFLVFCRVSAWSQESLWVTPGDSADIFSFHAHIHGIEPARIFRLDSGTHFIHEYDPIRSNGFYTHLGNSGLPARELVPAFEKPAGFYYRTGTQDIYRLFHEDLPYYHSSSAYSEIRYVMGPDKENNLQATYNRNVYRGLNLGLFYRLISSTGPYLRQKTDLDNLAFRLRYLSKSKHYGVFASYIRNGFDFQQNGGIVSDEVFEDNTESRRSVIPVRLTSAVSQEYGNVFTVSQYWEPGFGKRIRTVISDSLNVVQTDSLIARQDTLMSKPAVKKESVFSLGRFAHTLTYSNEALSYSDPAPLSGFYPSVLRDSTVTFDSVTLYNFSNEVTWTNSLFLYKTSFPLKLSFGMKHILAGVKTDSTHVRKFQQVIPSASVLLEMPAGLRLGGRIQYVTGDYNGGDMLLEGKLERISASGRWEMAALTRAESMKPGFFYSWFKGNHQQWDQDFEREDIFMLGGYLKGPNTLVMPEYRLISGMVYLGPNALPRQRQGSFSLLRLRLSQGLRLGHWRLDGTCILQKPTDTVSLRIPEIILKGTISVAGYIFQNALWVEPGITVFWYSSYFGDAYMPSLNAFYLQSEKAVGNFPVSDLFLNMKVARARLFLRYRHFHSSFSGYNYWGAPHYPLQDVGLNFGVIWPFYD